jgi:hypothetical protein
VLGLTEPFTAMGLGPPVVMDQAQNGLEPTAQPSLEEVLAIRLSLDPPMILRA